MKNCSKLYEMYPQLEGRVEYVDLGTPLTNNYYINSVLGESYGLEHTPKRMTSDWIRPDTPIPGLWLTGQDLLSCGVFAALLTGYVTAAKMDTRVLLKNATYLVSA